MRIAEESQMMCPYSGTKEAPPAISAMIQSCRSATVFAVTADINMNRPPISSSHYSEQKLLQNIKCCHHARVTFSLSRGYAEPDHSAPSVMGQGLNQGSAASFSPLEVNI